MRQLFLIIPIGILGIVRWASWLIRRLPAVMYRPFEPGHREPLTVVTPVYQEDPVVFRAAVESWLANEGVQEVIAVIDETDTACIEIAKSLPIQMIVTDVPGKRDALRRGWEVAKTDIVALVDSDTVWADDVAALVVEPFADPKIGGVCPRQNVLNPRSIWQRMNDFYLDYRYFDEVAGQTKWGRAVSCLSGRTAVYRRSLLLEISDDFMSETFMGVTCNSGEDKRLTMLTLRHGYQTYLQQNARVWSTFPAGARSFFRQRLRWARNTWRSDLRTLKEGWIFRHKWLAFSMIDKAISAFTLLVAPVFMIIALVTRHFAIAGFLALWWLVSRGMKYLPHLERRPADIFLLPVFIVTSFLAAILKIVALFSIRRQKWLTRDVEVVNGKAVRTIGGAPKPAAGMARIRLNPGTILGSLLGVVALIGISTGLADAQPATSTTASPGASTTAPGTQPGTGPGAPTPVGNCLDPAEPPVRDTTNKLYNGTNDKRALQPYSPFRMAQVNCVFPADYRAIVVDPAIVRLQAGGKIVREIALTTKNAPLNLPQLVQAVADPGWIAQPQPGIIEVKAAIIQRAGSNIVVSSPVKEVRLVDRPHVFMGGRASRIAFDGVKVTSWKRDGSGPDDNYRDGRPFVLYSEGSQFDIKKSTFTMLGSDRAGSYGIAWRLESSGTIEDSTFTKNFFGQYSYEADGLSYRRNSFTENVFYGVDPHDRSRNLVFENNKFENNGSHGAIVSQEVFDSVFRNNTSINNGGNGMVIDAGSFNVTFENNEVRGNGQDGIVILGSRENEVVNNIVVDNRVGIRVNGEGSSGNKLVGNTIETNNKGIEAYGGATSLEISGGTVKGNKAAGMTLDAPGSRLTGVAISGSPVGIELRSPADAETTTVSDVAVGVAIKSPERVTLRGMDINATEIGVRVDRRSAATLTQAKIVAPTAFKGSEAIERGSDLDITTLGSKGIHWFGVAGGGFLVAAILLEVIRKVRARKYESVGLAPQIVANPI